MSMRLAALVPTYFPDTEDGRHRRRVWRYLEREHWGRLGDVPVYCGRDRLAVRELCPFSVSRAINDAARHARLAPGVQGFVIMGADQIPDPVALEYAARMLEHWPWVRLYSRIAYLDEGGTRKLLDGGTAAWPVHIEAPCPGVVAVRRDVWDQVGGMDERYEGWGYEDDAFCEQLRKVAGSPAPTSPYTLRELWHDPARRIAGPDNPNHQLFNGRRA